MQSHPNVLLICWHTRRTGLVFDQINDDQCGRAINNQWMKNDNYWTLTTRNRFCKTGYLGKFLIGLENVMRPRRTESTHLTESN